MSAHPGNIQRSKAVGAFVAMSGDAGKGWVPVKTVACYYCGLHVHQAYMQTHLEQCDMALEQCPNSCGAAVQRRYMEVHVKKECYRRQPSAFRAREGASGPENEVTKLRSLMEEERRLRHVAVSEWKQRHDALESWNKKIVSVLDKFKQMQSEECAQRDKQVDDLKQQIKSMQQQVLSSRSAPSVPPPMDLRTAQALAEIHTLKKVFQEEKTQRLRSEGEYDEQLARFQNTLTEFKTTYQKRCLDIDAWKLHHISQLEEVRQTIQDEIAYRTRDGNKTNKIETAIEQINSWKIKTQSELEAVKLLVGLKKEAVERKEANGSVDLTTVNKELYELQEKLEKCQQDLSTFKKFLEKENAMISGVWMEQEKKIARLHEDVTASILPLQATVVRQSLRMDNIEESVERFSDNVHSTHVRPGNLIWKISNYEAKLSDAKENNTSILSPVFYSTEFGYKLRLEVHLNGIGQWKGRHIIISLKVLKGEWDSLLQWPFAEKVTIILRDQTQPPDKTNDLSKVLVTGKGKGDPQDLHQFIPHNTLQEHNFLHDNSIILEVQVN